jgi:hypothetical protein
VSEMRIRKYFQHQKQKENLPMKRKRLSSEL